MRQSGSDFAGADAINFIRAERFHCGGRDEVHVDRVAEDVKHLDRVSSRAIGRSKIIYELHDITFAQSKLGKINAHDCVLVEFEAHCGVVAEGIKVTK